MMTSLVAVSCASVSLFSSCAGPPHPRVEKRETEVSVSFFSPWWLGLGSLEVVLPPTFFMALSSNWNPFRPHRLSDWVSICPSTFPVSSADEPGLMLTISLCKVPIVCFAAASSFFKTATSRPISSFSLLLSVIRSFSLLFSCSSCFSRASLASLTFRCWSIETALADATTIFSAEFSFFRVDFSFLRVAISFSKAAMASLSAASCASVSLFSPCIFEISGALPLQSAARFSLSTRLCACSSLRFRRAAASSLFKRLILRFSSSCLFLSHSSCDSISSLIFWFFSLMISAAAKASL